MMRIDTLWLETGQHDDVKISEDAVVGDGAMLRIGAGFTLYLSAHVWQQIRDQVTQANIARALNEPDPPSPDEFNNAVMRHKGAS